MFLEQFSSGLQIEFYPEDVRIQLQEHILLHLSNSLPDQEFPIVPYFYFLSVQIAAPETPVLQIVHMHRQTFPGITYAEYLFEH